MQPALFDVEKFKKLLTTQWIAQSFLYFEELESTSTYLKKLPADDISHGLLCLADNQTKGRGQYNRNWESSPGKNLTFTLAFTPMEARRFHVLTLACARAVVDQIEHETGVEAYIKWPNDVVVDGRKVGGLLTETVFNGNHLDRVLVGIGLNLNQAEFSDPMVKAGAISLRQLADKEINREQFLCEYLHRVEHQYQRWHKHNDALLKNINQKILGYGRWIKLNVNGDELQRQYKLLGVNDKGQLAVIDGEGGLETFSYEQIRLITD